MFDALSASLQNVFRRLRGYGRLSERNIQEALREVRLALLEADVHYEVARTLVERVRARSLGREVLESVTPGQQFIKLVHDELVVLLGGQAADFDFSGSPAQVMLLGLHGSGKTTTAAKLARQFRAGGRSTLLVACDTRRPAAVDQLRILAGQVGADLVAPAPGEAAPELAARGLAQARATGAGVVLYDTGGRFQIDTELVDELKAMRAAVQPKNVVLVLDAAIGQESVNVAQTFHQALGLTGLILTKLDGDARGGAALSVRERVGCPVLRVGAGERPEDLEMFHPDRMASRILGFGDVVTLVERAETAFDLQTAEEAAERLQAGQFTLDDFLLQLQQVRKLGPLERVLEMLPGSAKLPAGWKEQMSGDSGAELQRTEAIIRSMTPQERRNTDLLNASRRRRIARGSGTQVADVNRLLKNFEHARRMFRELTRAHKRQRRR